MMSLSIVNTLAFSPEVKEFLKQRHAEEEFDRTLELARACYPDRCGIDVFLHEDWELAGWWYVVIRVAVPTTLSLERLQEQSDRYYDLLVSRVPSKEFPDSVCQVRVDFVES